MIGGLHTLSRILLAVLLAGALTSCTENLAERAVCEAGDGQVSLAWQALPGIDQYRVFRANDGMTAEPIGEVDGASFVDTGVQNGTRYGYIVRAVVPDGVEVPDIAACAVTPGPDGGEGPEPVADLSCRAKNGRIDLDWTEIAGASSYRVLRSGNGQTDGEIGDVVETAFADFGLVNGVAYSYEVVALDAQGNASDDSNAVQCTPIARGEGDPPPVVAAPTCRGKNDKVDVSWTPVDGAAYYEIARALPGQPPVVLGTVTGNVFADFGLPLDVAQQYTVASVSATGAQAQPSPVCDVTPRGRADGNRPPVFTSEPLTSAIEQHNWYIQLAANDPDGDAVAFSVVVAPAGMKLTGPALLTWIPAATQIGTQVVELRATDSHGAFSSQAFVVAVTDWNEPPVITSAPNLSAAVGQPYQYDVDGFDPEGGALRFSFASAAPPGASIDPDTGLLTWTPGAGAIGKLDVGVRVTDVGGVSDTQTYALDVFTGGIDIESPKGSFEVEVGDTLELPLRANQPLAKFRVFQLPANAGGTADQSAIRFAPASPAAVGVYTLIVKAKLGGVQDAETIQVRVTNGNRPPTLVAPGAQTVDEGSELVIPIAATDPDGDLVTLSLTSAAPANALFDAVAGRLVFRPSFEQAGSYAFEIAASDGDANATATVPVVVNEREPSPDIVDLVVDPPPTPTLRPSARISGNVRGDPSQPPGPEPLVAITGVSPAIARQGQQLEVALTGLNTDFLANASAADFGEGVAVESLTVTSPTQATARVRVEPSAALGNRAIRVAGNGPDATSVVAFRIEPGATVLTGRLVDSFTQLPLAGSRVLVDGTSIEVETDADGRFRIEGVPPGAQRIVIARNDYDVETLELVFESNKNVDLTEDVPLDALARPFQPGGSLPRSATLASILDRGVAGGTEPLTQEQAEALVTDTLIVVGGRLVGVLDESGEQLNPNIDGVGMLSVKREGVAAQARALLQGQRLTLREISKILTEAFDWGASPPDEAALVGMLGRFAKAAWDDPGNPLNAMAFVLLNEGTSPLARPPTVTPDTTLNRFQASLLFTAILLPSVHRLDRQADELLRQQGIDPDTLGLRTPAIERGLVLRTLDGARRLIDALIPLAHAQGTGEVILGPNTNVEADTFAGQTFTRMTNYAWRSFAADLVVGNLINAGVQTAIKAGIALAIGSTGGVTGITLATGFIASMLEGAGMSLLEKLALGYVIAAAADSLEPAPPLPQRSFIDKLNDKLVIEFARSASEVADENRGDDDVSVTLRQHSYELFEFRTPNSTDVRDAVELDVATVSESQRDPSKLQFAIPLGMVAGGVHYYRMATIQYLSAVALPLDEAKSKFSYRMQRGAEDVPDIVADFQDPVYDWTNYVKGQYHIQDAQKLAIDAAVGDEMRAKYGTTTDIFADDARAKEVEIAALNKEKVRVEGAIKTQQAQFDVNTNYQVDKVENLSRYANARAAQPGFDPNAFRNAGSPEAGTVLKTMQYYRGGDTYRSEVGSSLAQMAESRQTAIAYQARAGVHATGITDLEQLKAGIADGSIDPSAHGKTVRTYDVVTGQSAHVDLNLPSDRAAAVAHLDQSIALENDKLDLAQRTVRDAEVDIDDTVARMKNAEVPSANLHEASLAEKVAEGEALEKRVQDASRVQRERVRQSRHFRQNQGNYERVRTERWEAAKPKTQAVLGALNVVGGLAQIAGELNDIYEGTKLLYSDFSPPFRYTHDIRNIPQWSVETDPNLHMPDAIVIGRKGELYLNELGQLVDESKTGWLRTTFFDTGENEAELEAGFPPEFLAVDAEGRFYAHNANSATRFGGRIFRYDSQNGLAREFVGSVNYYSTLIQYGKPSAPVAMATGRVLYAGQPVETLFVADIEQVGTGGVALERPKPVIKHLPIDLLEEGQPYHDGGTRNHFVGQPYVEDDRFRFTGPTDMVAYDDGTGTHRLYVSDEDKIFVVRSDLAGGAVEVREILSTPGFQWSGLALDDSPSPNFYFADYRSGFVYWVKHSELLAAEQAGLSLFEFARPLAALQQGGASIQPYDIDVHQGQRKLVGTSRRGIFSMHLPILLPAAPGDPVLFLKRLGREYRSKLMEGLNGLVYRVLPISQYEQDYARARIVARSGNGDPVGATTIEYDLTLPPAGPAEVELDQ